jgi:hypothetical protein
MIKLGIAANRRYFEIDIDQGGEESIFLFKRGIKRIRRRQIV